MEIWLVIEEAPRYAVSDQGRIKNINTGLVLSHGFAGKGYPVVNIYINGRYRMRYVHVLVATAFHEKLDAGLEVNHKDTIKTNNFSSNLEWTTHLENQQHASFMGRMNNSGRKKTPIRIVETGQIFESQAECARFIGGRQSSIWLCLSGKLKTHMGYTFEYVR